MRQLSKGFSLVELIAIVVIMGVLAFVSAPRFVNFEASLQASRDDVVAALFFAQQIAMARDSTANPIQFVSTSSSFTVTEDGADLLNGGTQYPVDLPSGVTMDVRTFHYDKLGRTSAANITLSKGSSSVDITVSNSGYAQ